MATLDERERQAIARMPKWQREMLEENEREHERKSGIPVRKVSKAYIEEHGKRLIQLESAFVGAGEEIRQANQESGLLFATKDDMIDLGIWPLMQNWKTGTGLINGERWGGFNEDQANHVLDRMEEKYGENPFWRRPSIEKLKEFISDGGRNRHQKPQKEKKGKKK